MRILSIYSIDAYFDSEKPSHYPIPIPIQHEKSRSARESSISSVFGIVSSARSAAAAS
ncbi:hypothetical protein C7S16_6001 [Burkholderia thailandensis]|uniref:Uncharacterized protein n=1 Tax=Burkholderia thailandensis TaxID=57975 RepID=A0AAW9CPT5_BURTH|nr:hypothetical protein [Burkholderia thailandensis]MDW9252645.1 hypothetical protein [Burkholderia thailandensis]